MTVKKLIEILSNCPCQAAVGVIGACENPEADYVGINRVINMTICYNDNACAGDENQVILVTN